MIAGVGTDVVDIDRFRKLWERREFLEQVFTANEIHAGSEGPAPDSFFAMLFAVKEAVLKAMGCGLQRMSLWREIEVTKNEKLHLSGSLQQLAKEKSIQRVHISKAHSGNDAVAFVVLETTDSEEIA
jgi:holo-[acyl-carrier protein] synthase